jgi:hypothetical protein
MIEPAPKEMPDAAARHSARVRKLGASVLVTGFIAAAIVYWIGARPRDFGDDAATVGFYKPEARQMGMLYGQMGVMMDDLVAFNLLSPRPARGNRTTSLECAAGGCQERVAELFGVFSASGFTNARHCVTNFGCQSDSSRNCSLVLL